MEEQNPANRAEKTIPLSAVAPLMDLLSDMIASDPEPYAKLVFRYDDLSQLTGHTRARKLVLKSQA